MLSKDELKLVMKLRPGRRHRFGQSPDRLGVTELLGELVKKRGGKVAKVHPRKLMLADRESYETYKKVENDLSEFFCLDYHKLAMLDDNQAEDIMYKAFYNIGEDVEWDPDDKGLRPKVKLQSTSNVG